MIRLRSGPLAAWATAWLAGRAASDEVLRSVTDVDAAHRVLREDGSIVPLGAVLIDWRAQTRRVVLVLPVPADLRGVPGPVAFRTAALDAGEAVVADGHGYVPEVREHHPSSAPTSVLWREFPVGALPVDVLDVRSAHHELAEAIRETAAALRSAQVAGGRPGVAEAVAGARRAGDRPNLPPGHPAPAVQLVAQAERMRAVLDLAEADPIGGAVDRAGIEARATALRPLATAVRRARLAGYNA